MSRRLDTPNAYGGTTDHSEEIEQLRFRGTVTNDGEFAIFLFLAADLLEAHDQTGISLDNWTWARLYVERFIGNPIVESGV